MFVKKCRILCIHLLKTTAVFSFYCRKAFLLVGRLKDRKSEVSCKHISKLGVHILQMKSRSVRMVLSLSLFSSVCTLQIEKPRVGNKPHTNDHDGFFEPAY